MDCKASLGGSFGIAVWRLFRLNGKSYISRWPVDRESNSDRPVV